MIDEKETLSTEAWCEQYFRLRLELSALQKTMDKLPEKCSHKTKAGEWRVAPTGYGDVVCLVCRTQFER